MADTMEIIISAIDSASGVFQDIISSAQGMAEGITGAVSQAGADFESIANNVSGFQDAVDNVDQSELESLAETLGMDTDEVERLLEAGSQIGSLSAGFNEAAIAADELEQETEQASESVEQLGSAGDVMVAQTFMDMASTMKDGMLEMADSAGTFQDSIMRASLEAEGAGIPIEQMTSTISGLSDATGRSAGQIRESFIKALARGVTDMGSFETMMKGAGAQATLLGTDIQTMGDKFSSMAQKDTLMARTLAETGITMDELGTAMGMTGATADEVKAKYLNRVHDDILEMKPEYDTQRKIEAIFEGKTSDQDIWIRDGLYSLISDVLFIRDSKDPNKFHPRISVQFDFVYEALWDNDKAAFNKLYNDYYYRRNNQFWYGEAMKKLPRLVEATRMLVCAEDLGMVPDCVPWVMNQLRILSLELQSMPKDPTVKFGHLSRNPYRSVCTISSHDMPTLRQWWDEDWERTQEYYNTMLHREGPAPHPLPGWLARNIISRHLASPSMLCVLSIQDWMAIDEKLRLADQNAERINIPANPRHYWRYRMHVNIEDLINNQDFSHCVSELILEAGRK